MKKRSVIDKCSFAGFTTQTSITMVCKMSVECAPVSELLSANLECSKTSFSLSQNKEFSCPIQSCPMKNFCHLPVQYLALMSNNFFMVPHRICPSGMFSRPSSAPFYFLKTMSSKGVVIVWSILFPRCLFGVKASCTYCFLVDLPIVSCGVLCSLTFLGTRLLAFRSAVGD